MNITSDKPSGYRYGAGKVAKSVTFYCAAPNANSVCLVGDFNRWNPASHPDAPAVDGWWFMRCNSLTATTLSILGGRQSRFLDPRARVIAATSATSRFLSWQ